MRLLSEGQFDREKLNTTIRVIACASLLMFMRSTGIAQSPVAPQEFDVASVKPVRRTVVAHAVSLSINHGTVTFDAAALRQIIGLSYGVQRVRVKGGPNWMDTELYDIVAKTESPDASKEQVMVMMQALLADRFKLVVHRETKELPVYSLVVGKGGSKLKEASDSEKPGSTIAIGRFVFQKMSLVILVNTLANLLGEPVLDKTGLTGLYDYGLDLTLDKNQLQGPRDSGPSPPVDLGPVIFEALQDQLGLKLEAKRGPAEVLIVDRAEHASEN
jgi:uncharacterized protein (TIGR03435 family)